MTCQHDLELGLFVQHANDVSVDISKDIVGNSFHTGLNHVLGRHFKARW